MSRSLKKGLYVDAKLQKKIEALSAEDRTIIKTWARCSTISPEMVGRTIAVHNGRVHVPVFVTEFGVGRADGDGDINEEQSEIWINLLNEEKVSHIIWNLSNKDETSSIIAAKCDKTFGFTDEDLSPCGLMMKEIMAK